MMSMAWLRSESFHLLAQIIVGGVWVFHGLYSKVFNRIPRHQMIVAKVLGARIARPATILIGVLEFLLGVWVFTGWWPVVCVSVQTAALVGMNILEILLARELLISAPGMVVLNIILLSVAWCWALFSRG